MATKNVEVPTPFNKAGYLKSPNWVSNPYDATSYASLNLANDYGQATMGSDYYCVIANCNFQNDEFQIQCYNID